MRRNSNVCSFRDDIHLCYVIRLTAVVRSSKNWHVYPVFLNLDIGFLFAVKFIKGPKAKQIHIGSLYNCQHVTSQENKIVYYSLSFMPVRSSWKGALPCRDKKLEETSIFKMAKTIYYYLDQITWLRKYLAFDILNWPPKTISLTAYS